MPRYHINNKGNPGVCHATKSCPFGDLLGDHYNSAEEARIAYEKANETLTWSKIRDIMLTPTDPNAPISLGEMEEPISLADLPDNLPKALTNDLPSQILIREAELSALRDKKIGASAEEIKKINGEIRGKSIHLSKMKRSLEHQNFSEKDIDKLLKVNETNEKQLEFDSAETRDAVVDAIDAAWNIGIDSNSIVQVASDASLAERFFEEEQRSLWNGVPEDVVESQKYRYINDALKNPVAVQQLREKYDRD